MDYRASLRPSTAGPAFRASSRGNALASSDGLIRSRSGLLDSQSSPLQVDGSNIPFLPGFKPTHDPTKTYHGLKYAFSVENKADLLAPRAIPTRTQSAKPSMNYTERRSLIKEKEKFVPHFAALDKKVLRFFGYFQEPVHERAGETYRVRKLAIYYHLVDDTVEINEPKQENSGVPQGTFLKRQKLPKPSEEGEDYSLEDFYIGADIDVFGKVVHVVDADDFTRGFFEQQGATLPAGEGYPEDPYEKVFYSSNKLAILRQSNGETNAFRIKSFDAPHPKDSRKLLWNDRKVLRFDAVWKEPNYGAKVRFKVHFFLADDTMEIVEAPAEGTKRDPFAINLKRQKFPRVMEDDKIVDRIGHPATNCYDEHDLVVGKSITIYGRVLQLVKADPFTQTYYLHTHGLDQNANCPPPSPKSSKRAPLKVPSYNPHGMYGSREDSLRNCFVLQPKAPRQDRDKFDETDQKVLRFTARLVSNKPQDSYRRFLFTYYLIDDGVMIFEPPVRNSGIIGGKFLEKTRIENPDRIGHDGLPEYYTVDDFYEGSIIKVNGCEFLLGECDGRSKKLVQEIQAARRTAEEDADVSFADKKLRRKLLETKHTPRQLFEKFGDFINCRMTLSQFTEMVRFYKILLADEKMPILFDLWDTDHNGVLDFNEFQNCIRKFIPEVAAFVPHIEELKAKVRQCVARRGAHSIRGLRTALKRMDKDGSGKLDKKELKEGLMMYGVLLEAEELDALFYQFDRNHDGVIDFSEFMRAIRGQLNEARKEVVNMAFDVLDVTKDGFVTLDDMRQIYDPTCHPKVLSGKMTEEEALSEFLSQWDTIDKDGIVTREEFEDYYQDLSASIDNDEMFVEIVSRAWGLTPESMAYSRRIRAENEKLKKIHAQRMAEEALQNKPTRLSLNSTTPKAGTVPVKLGTPKKQAPSAFYLSKGRPF